MGRNREEKTSLRTYALFGFGLGVLAVVVNLLLLVVLGWYVNLDYLGVVVLALSISRAEYRRYVRRGRQARFRTLVVPVLAACLPYLLPQAPLVLLLFSYWKRRLAGDLFMIGLMAFITWLYGVGDVWEERWRRFITWGTPAQPNELRMPTAFLIAGVVGTLFFGALLVLSNTVIRNETVTWWTNLVFAAFTFLGLLIIVAYFRERHILTEEGIWYRPPLGLGRRRFLAWDEVVAVDYNPWAQWFVLKARDGRKVRVDFFVTNGERFARMLRARAPYAVISDRAMRLLGGTEGGGRR